MAEQAHRSKVEDTLELVEAFNAGDREALASRLSDDAEIRTIRSELEGRAYIGPEGLREAYRDWEKEWEFVRFVLGDGEENEGFAVLDLRIQAKGKASGVELDAPIWLLWEFDGEQIVRLRSYSDRDAARREARLDS